MNERQKRLNEAKKSSGAIGMIKADTRQTSREIHKRHLEESEKQARLDRLRNIAKDVTAHWLSGDDLTNDEIEDLWIGSEENEEQFAIIVRGRLHQIADDEMAQPHSC